MKKRIFGRRLKRDIKERKALFRGLIRGLVLYGKIQTTEAKAKAVKSQVEKLVTKAKKQGNDASRLLRRDMSPEVADRLIADIAPAFSERNGGYVRIFRTGKRVKDSAQMVMMEFVMDTTEEKSLEPVSKPSTVKEKKPNAQEKAVEKPKQTPRKTREKSNTRNKK